jgi:hypothetical protein
MNSNEDMNIPGECIAIVNQHLLFYLDQPNGDYTVEARSILAKIAPIMAAQALEERRQMKISDEAVEAAAKGRFENCDYADWEFIKEPARSEMLADMRAALEAALPILLSQMREWAKEDN